MDLFFMMRYCAILFCRQVLQGCHALYMRQAVATIENVKAMSRTSGKSCRAASGNLVTEDGLELLEHQLDRTKAKRAAKRPAPSRQASQAPISVANPL